MTIAVDVLMHHGWHKGPSCHLISLTNDQAQLDAFALDIGLRRSWKDGDHYDLVASKRRLAVERGAVEVTRQDEAYREWLKSRRARHGTTA